MKKNIFFLLFCFPVLLFGQRYIKGRVVDVETNKPIADIAIRLQGSDGTDIDAYSDSLGHYYIDSTDFSAKIDYIVYAMPAKGTDNYYESSKMSIASYPNNRVDTISLNFTLKSRRICVDSQNPFILFPSNSISLSQGVKDTVLSIWYKIMTSNPSIAIEIDGHADSKEENSVALSLKRAEACKEYLTSKGIDSARITAKGWGCSRPLIHQNEIRKAKTTLAKDSLAQLNRRVVFQFVRWDYSKK